MLPNRSEGDTLKLVRRVRYLSHRGRERLQAARRRTDETDRSLSLDMGCDSGTLLLAFGGMNRAIGMPPFEFLSLTGSIPVKKLFVRDPRQAWYHRGIPQYGDSLMAAAERLGSLVDELGVEKLVVVGNSAGGYAALVYGTQLSADRVLCFAPQTTLDLQVLSAMGDHRWDYQLKPLARSGALDVRWQDLQMALPAARRADTEYDIYFAGSEELDRLHAERLSELEGARLHRFDHGEHALVRSLRDSGALGSILQSALA